MTAVDQILADAREAGRAVLVGYLPVGYPDVEGSIRAMQALVEAGVDIVEIGVPYTDPLMDGPVIQTAATGALAAGVRVRDVFTAVEAVSDAGAGALVMTYWNPVLRYGVERFAADLAGAGGSGLITPDLVPDEAGPWLEASAQHGLNRVFLVAPSSTHERLASTTAAGSGFVYAASLMGVTGARASVGEAAQTLVERTREVTDLPICVGLGVSTPEQVAQVAGFADGVIVGSALVRCLVDAPDLDTGLADLRALASDLVAGARQGRG
ncbi:tryptophan synthase subunit alpha [Dermacoccaceae bacterium W4C1]